MADIEITEAGDIEAIARELIPQFHPHLAEASIRYLRSTQDKKDKGKSVAAHMGKFNDLNRYLASGTSADIEEGEQYFLMVYDAFRFFDQAQRRACVDHELNHLTVVGRDKKTDEEKLGFIGHDVEEFAAVIQRHGLWNVDIREFETKARQMSLDGVLEDAKGIVRKMHEDLEREGLSATFSTNIPGSEPVTIGAKSGRGAE